MQLLEISSLVESEYVESVMMQATMEAHFSKKEMTNPDTVKKILSIKHGYINIVKWMNALIGILAVIISIPTIVGPVLVAGLFLSIAASLDSYPKRTNDKTIHRLEESCKKLKEKTLAYIETRPDKKAEKQKTIDGCDKVLKEIEKYYKACKDEKFMADVDAAEKMIIAAVKFMEKPRSLEMYQLNDLVEVANIYKINEKYVLDRIDKFGERSKNPVGDLFGSDEKSRDEASNIPEIKNNSPIVYVLTDDNYWVIYSPATKSLWSYAYDGPAKKTSLYVCGTDGDDIPSKEAFIEADKRLGYYRLSKCPDAVIPKKLLP